MNLPLNPGDLRELVERRDHWDDVTEVDLSVQHRLHVRRLSPVVEPYSWAEETTDHHAVMRDDPNGPYVALGDVTEVDLSVQHQRDPYPTLHAIGLGPQLAELERICAEAYKGKHAGETIIEWGEGYHWNKAISHINRGEFGQHDSDSGARHLIHAAARLLMAAACLDGVDHLEAQLLDEAER